MAESRDDREREDLSEEASPYRLEEYRRKGRVAQSRELAGWVGLMAAATALYAFSPGMGESLLQYMREAFRVDLAAKMNFGDLQMVGKTCYRMVEILAKLTLPIAFIGFVIGALASFAQIGPVFSLDPLEPQVDKINPINGIQRLLSMKQLIDGIRIVFKGSVVLIISYFLVKSEIIQSPYFALMDPQGMFGAISRSGWTIFLVLSLALLIFAGADFWVQRWEFSKNVRMTRRESKEEHKEREGDPLIKARIRTVQREMARKRMMQAVKKADVVVTNPTHIAVALIYDRTQMKSPKVVAKGADFLAQRIKKIAADAGVPLVENVPLARTLFKSVKVGQLIPEALYQAVAEVLAYVYRLKAKRSGQS